MVDAIAEGLNALPVAILTWTTLGALGAVGLLLAHQMWSDPGFFSTLLRVKVPGESITNQPLSPARVQFLLASLAAAGALILASIHGRPLELPQELVYALLGSNATYLALKGRQIQLAHSLKE